MNTFRRLLRCLRLLLPAMACWGCASNVDSPVSACASSEILSVAERSEPDAERLGRQIFGDPRLSADGRVSCATCHPPDLAFADSRPVSTGAGGRTGLRNAPSLLDVASQKTLFWDGRRRTLEAQALDPLTSPIEHGLSDIAAVLKVLQSDAVYRSAFRDAYRVSPGCIGASHVADALASFQRTLISGPTPFDRYLSGDVAAITASAERGWALFRGRYECARCHTVEGARPTLTDHGFHSIAVSLASVSERLHEMARRASVRPALGRTPVDLLNEDPGFSELGRYLVTGVAADIGKFKTPPLRNVARTAPYMHDGSLPTLEAAVELELRYRVGGPSQQGSSFSPQDLADLVAFLNALTSEGDLR